MIDFLIWFGIGLMCLLVAALIAIFVFLAIMFWNYPNVVGGGNGMNPDFWQWFEETARPRLGFRAETFARMFEHLDGFDRPVTIVETGCARRDPTDDESWKGDGCSTIQFDVYCHLRGDSSAVSSVDLSMDAVDACKKRTPNALIFCEDSVGWLRKYSKFVNKWPASWKRADLLYLDSHDFVPHDPLPSAIHHHNELMAALPIIRPHTLVVVDDAPVVFDDLGRTEIGGKGFLVAKHMMLAGADLAFSNYQTGWTNVGSAQVRGDDDVRTLVDRARAHVEADRVMPAEHLYRLILGLTTPPRSGVARVAHGEACAFYARLALARQKHGTAADWYREAIQADPLATDYRVDLILNCFLPMANTKAALTEAQRATRISPDHPGAWKALGGIYHEMGDASRAAEAYTSGLAVDPSNPDALLDRATIALDMCDYDLVRDLCARVKGTERWPDAVHCLAMVAYREHRHEDAEKLYAQAIELGCRDQPVVHWNRSLTLHSIGRYREAWVEHEHREHQRTNPALFLPMKRFTLPRWAGEPPIKEDGSPALIHVHYEAGAGDNLALARYLNILVYRGYHVRFECADEMVDLMRSSFPGVDVVQKAPDYPGALGVQPFDYHCPTGSLPAVLGTDIDTIPWDGPYLHAEPELVEQFKNQLGLAEQRPKVGLCWSSGIRDQGVWIKEYGRRKSMHFDALMSLRWAGKNNSRASLVSLQVGPEREQHGGLLIDILPEKPTWGETAALIANLDLVITVDTGVAHLAGGMGKPVWVMCQRDAASWHFMCWRPGAPWNDRSPWYPSARVFRQRTFDQPHVWGDVVAEVATALKDDSMDTRDATAAE